jgi:hypothetical protein
MAKTRNQGQDPPPTRKRKSKSTSSSQPPPPPPPSPPHDPPPYDRFIIDEAAERYRAIKGNTFTKERGFNFEKLTQYPIFQEKIEEKGWQGIVNMITVESNQSIALEFLANAYVERSGGVQATVRGKDVSYHPDDIARVLGLTSPDECGVKVRRKELGPKKTKDEWDVLLAGLVREGTGWKGHGGQPQRIDVVDLLPVYKA